MPLVTPMPVCGPINPKAFLNSLVGKGVTVKLVWGQVYKGYLQSTDRDMNLELVSAEEFIDDELQGNLGNIMIRHSSVLYIQENDEEEKQDEPKDETPPEPEGDAPTKQGEETLP